MTKKAKNKKLLRFVLRIVEWLIYIFAYTLVFILLDYVFDTFKVDEAHFILYSFVAVTLIYILNMTAKPVLFRLTLPLTGITFGLFYFVINMVILKLVEFIMNDRIEFTSLPKLFFISIFMSIINLLIENLAVKPLLKLVKFNE